MEKLRVRQDVYQIEVNDNGEFIEFNLRDINLPEKILNGAEKIEKERENYLKKIKEVKTELKGQDLIREITKIEEEYFNNTRKYFDEFLGDGACRKIFGETNCYGMFESLMEELEKHYAKMELQMDAIKNDLVAKYSYKDKEVM